MHLTTLRSIVSSIKNEFSYFRYRMSVTDAAGESCTWRGVSLTEIYGSQSPWGSPEFPLVSPSYNHAVLYHIPNDGIDHSDRPPKPQIGHDKWDHDHVRLPCSSQSLYPIEKNGQTTLKKRWEIIEEALQKPLENSEQLANAILSYNTKFKTVWRFHALHTLFNEYLEEEESQYFFTVTLPEIAKLALALPKLIQSPIPLLKQHKNKSVSLSQQQISSLLANAFFCTFPRRNTSKSNSEYASYPHINFTMLYESGGSDSVLEKLKCICYYFRIVTTKAPAGVVSLTRRSLPPRRLPPWPAARAPLAATPLHVNSTGTIEDDGIGLIQVDFANMYLGGGVLGRGCVQEEIRFVICPELLVGMLFTEVLRPNEALLIIGCERYSDYTGYGSTFRWAGGHCDVTPRDCSRRRRTAVLAIDALPFNSRRRELRPDCVLRELNKAWVGMSIHTSQEDPTLQRPGVATGNWGCGAFGGSPPLKCLIQLMAATEARRPMAYYTFSDVELRNNFINMYHLLAKHNVTVGQLYNYITRFSESGAPTEQLYEFLHQCMLDDDGTDGPEKMDVSASSDNQEPTEQPHINKNPPEVKITIVPQDAKKTENSPDMFSQESEDSPVLPKNKEINSSDIEPYVEQNKAQNVDKESDRTRRTSRLFDEMRRLDEESGKMNFDKSKEQSLSLSENSGVRSSDVETVSDEGLSAADVPSEVKKRLSKKITDYFSKKT